MRMVKCHECGNRYNYDEDGFCDRCGAFNQPPPLARIGADGSIVRVDGLNEQGHVGSFLHQEYHEEERERRKSGLDKSVVRIPKPVSKAVSAGKSAGRTLIGGSKQQAQKNIGLIVGIAVWFIVMILGFFV